MLLWSIAFNIHAIVLPVTVGMASGAFRRLRPSDSWRSRFSLPERLSGGRVERLLDYWKSVAGDYRESFQQLIDGVRCGINSETAFNVKHQCPLQ